MCSFDCGNHFTRYVHIKSWKKVKILVISHARLFVTPPTIAHPAPMSMEFSSQEYCSGLPCPSLWDFPNPGIKPGSPSLQEDSLTSEPPRKPY